MVFGFRKEHMPLERVIHDLAQDLTALHGTIDEFARKGGIDGHPSYGFEREALEYVVGCLAIQASRLKAPDEDRFSAELARTWAKRLQKDDDAGEAVRFLRDRLGSYQDALSGAAAGDRGMRLAWQFLDQLDTEPENQAPLVGALSGTLAGAIDSAASFISSVNQDFKVR